MHLEHPHMLLGLWLLPVVAWLLVWAQRRRRAAAARFADAAMRERIMPALVGPRPWIKGAAIVVALGLLITAVAGPRFGAYHQEITQRGADIFVVLDVSRSMTAEDVAPNRLERAKLDVRDLLERVGGDRVGLIAFAGKPIVLVPLTTDRGFFEMVLDSADTTIAPRGGTLIGDAIRKAIASMPARGDRDQAIVLITDGEDHESAPEEAAKSAAARGIKIFTVALGDSAEGARIPVAANGGGRKYLQYAGKEVWSKVDEQLLKRIADLTGGLYVPAGTKAYDLGQLYKDHLAKLAHGEYGGQQQQVRFRERYQWFLCLGVAMLLVGMAVPEYSKKQTALLAPSEER
jgi:Ca-activated chloride channel homolog